MGPRTDKHLQESPFTGNYFKITHFAVLSISLIFHVERKTQKSHATGPVNCCRNMVYFHMRAMYVVDIFN
jgi:hypothetical protein